MKGEAGYTPSRHRRKVHRVPDDSVLQKIAHRCGGFHADELLSLARGGGDVRSGHHLRQLLQTLIGGRLGLEHVQSRRGHLPRLDCVGQCLLVDEVSPRGVDQSNALFGSGQALGVHQVTGFFVCRHVERHVVGAGEQIVERDQFHAKVGRHLLRNERIVGDDAHSECRRAARDLLPNPSEACEPQGLVADLFAEKLLLLPLSLFHGGVSRRQVPGHREHQTHCQLRHAHAVRARRIHHDDATCACRRNIDIVDAGACAGDHPQLRRCGNQGRGHFCCTADDKCGCVGEVGGELIWCGPVRESTSHPSARSRSSAEDGRSSATMIFNACSAVKGTLVGAGITAARGRLNSESIICVHCSRRFRA